MFVNMAREEGRTGNYPSLQRGYRKMYRSRKMIPSA
jgi:hypothetical protein